MKQKRKRIYYYRKKTSASETGKEIFEKRYDKTGSANPEENESENVYSIRIQEPEKPEPQELTEEK